MPVGSALTKEQSEIELERRNFLEFPLQKSEYGPTASQTIGVFDGRVVCMTESGPYRMHHLTWEESLGGFDDERNIKVSWIETFAKALEIYQGKVKGFRGVVDDINLRKDLMKGQLKVLIHTTIDRVISQWKDRQALKPGKTVDKDDLQ